MSRLIHELLDFDRIQTGRLHLDGGLHAAPAMVDELLESLAPVAAERKVLLTADPAAISLPPVRCDRDRIVRVLDNLVSNAIKITPPGGAIVVRVAKIGGELRFAVADTGPGIADEDQPHVFDWLWRSRNASYKGTGRGLAIAKQIIEAHGGRIWLESALDVGTTFYFALPLQAE
jgi:signal transduction histidine kinase